MARAVKTKDAQPMGVYKPTGVDEMKANADFRLVDISYGNRIIWSNGTQQTVTNRELTKLKRSHTWMTDF